MRSRPLARVVIVVLLAGGGGAAWWYLGPNPEPLPPPSPKAAPAPAASLDADTLPIPPVPPRIAEGPQYDQCMTTVEDDPDTAVTMARAWRAAGGGDAAAHCEAMAQIAAGNAEAGAKSLEAMAHAPAAQGATRVVLLSQAAEAWLMAEKPDASLRDADEALTLSPDDPDLLMKRANARDALGRGRDAMDDLARVLRIDAGRGEALVLRAAIWRGMDMLAEAKSDVEKALGINPDDPEALLERGIVRQRMGDLKGARADWLRVRVLDPNSDTAELAEQNLTLLESGPKK